MRSVLVLAAMTVVAVPQVSRACPRGTRCITAGTQEVAASASARVEQPRARRISLRLTTDVAPREPALAMTPAPDHDDDPGVEMPWIWQVVRSQFYQRMPTYGGERELTLRLAPVVVAGQFDTIPGVGVAGEF